MKPHRPQHAAAIVTMLLIFPNNTSICIGIAITSTMITRALAAAAAPAAAATMSTVLVLSASVTTFTSYGSFFFRLCPYISAATSSCATSCAHRVPIIMRASVATWITS